MTKQEDNNKVAECVRYCDCPACHEVVRDALGEAGEKRFFKTKSLLVKTNKIGESENVRK